MRLRGGLLPQEYQLISVILVLFSITSLLFSQLTKAEVNTRLGTSIHKTSLWYFGINWGTTDAEARVTSSESLTRKILELGQKYALPPYKLNVYIIQSKHLGVMSFTMVLQNEADNEKVAKAIESAGFKAVRGGIGYRNKMDGYTDPPNKPITERLRRRNTMNSMGTPTTSNLMRASRSRKRTSTRETLRGSKNSSRLPSNSKSSKKDHRSIRKRLRKRKPFKRFMEVTAQLRDDAPRVVPHPFQQPDPSMSILGGPRSFVGDLDGELYLYENPGEGVVIYSIDSGCDIRHPELADIDIDDWISGGPYPYTEENDAIAGSSHRPTGHGTAVLGKIAGGKTGIAHNSTIIVAQLVSGFGSEEVPDSEISYLDCLLQIYDHILDNYPTSPIIVASSFVPSYRKSYQVEKEKLEKALKGQSTNLSVYEIQALAILRVMEELLALKRVVIVNGSGNGDEDLNTHYFKLPHDFPSFLKANRNFLMVGGFDAANPESDALDHWFDQIDDVGMILAPAVDVKVAVAMPPGSHGNSTELYRLADGTSYAAPAVAGLVAMWISAGIPIEEVTAYARNISRPRFPGDKFGAVWTGILPYDDLAEAKSRIDGFFKNDDADRDLDNVQGLVHSDTFSTISSGEDGSEDDSDPETDRYIYIVDELEDEWEREVEHAVQYKDDDEGDPWNRMLSFDDKESDGYPEDTVRYGDDDDDDDPVDNVRYVDNEEDDEPEDTIYDGDEDDEDYGPGDTVRYADDDDSDDGY